MITLVSTASIVSVLLMVGSVATMAIVPLTLKVIVPPEVVRLIASRSVQVVAQLPLVASVKVLTTRFEVKVAVGVAVAVIVEVDVLVTVAVEVEVAVSVLVAVVGDPTNSYEPMSHNAPCGRVKPR